MKFIDIDKAVMNENHTMTVFHSHPHYELYVLTSGSRQVFVGNQLFNLYAPSMILLPPHCLHRTEGGPYERYNINIMPQYIGDYEKNILNSAENTVISPNKKECDFMLGIVERLYNISHELPPPEAEYVAKSMFVSFLHAYRKQIMRLSDVERKTNPGASYLTLKILDYFDQHYGEKISLDVLAESLFMSTSAIIYNFKKDLGCTPIDFLLKVRLNKAKEMLLKTNKNITDIAFECGFSSPVYFGNIFKSKEGLSPRDYRKFRQIL